MVMLKGPCAIEGCTRPKRTRLHCYGHDRRLREYGDPLYEKPKPTLIDKFWSHVQLRGPDDCWEWDLVHPRGYGLVTHNGHTYSGHRISARIHFGMFDERLHVLHKCDNRPCVNPAHLYLGTAAENSRDRWVRGPQHHRRSATTCKHGHEYTPENTTYDTDGYRVCLECARRMNRESRHRTAARRRAEGAA